MSKEIKIVKDTRGDIEEIELTTLFNQGWKLILIINSNKGRTSDRYYFERQRNEE